MLDLIDERQDAFDALWYSAMVTTGAADEADGSDIDGLLGR